MDAQGAETAAELVIYLKLLATAFGTALTVIGVFLFDDRSRLRQLENDTLRKSDIDSIVALSVLRYFELREGKQ